MLARRMLNVAAALAMTASSAVAGTSRYILVDLGPVPRAISSQGLIAGEAGGGPGANTPVRLENGTVALPTLPGADNTVVRSVSNRGISAVIVQTNGGNDRAALISPAGATQLANLTGFGAAGAYDVNNGGVATGYVLLSGTDPLVEGSGVVLPNGTPQKAVNWTRGVPTALSDGGGKIVNSAGYAINNGGDVAGIARLPDNSVRAVTWDGKGALTILPIAADQVRSVARAISQNGTVAGTVLTAGGTLGAVWDKRGQTLLRGVGIYQNVVLRGIADDNTVVGFGGDADGNNAGLIWTLKGGAYTAQLLDTLIVNLKGWQTGAPQAVNNAGQIVGLGIAPDGTQRGYQLDPIGKGSAGAADRMPSTK